MKRHCRRLSRLIVLVLLLACGCTGTGTSGGDQGVLFEDSFDNPRSGWGADERAEFNRGYERGEYFIELHEPHWFIWVDPGTQFDDVIVETNVYLSSNSQDSHCGVLCRHVDVDNFYYFAISADGYYAIFRRVNGGGLDALTGDGSGMSPSSAIRTGGQTNNVTAVCQDDELSLYANGELLETVTDNTHARGDVGLGAGSGPEGGVRFQFDDFRATMP